VGRGDGPGVGSDVGTTQLTTSTAAPQDAAGRDTVRWYSPGAAQMGGSGESVPASSVTLPDAAMPSSPAATAPKPSRSSATSDAGAISQKAG